MSEMVSIAEAAFELARTPEQIKYVIRRDNLKPVESQGPGRGKMNYYDMNALKSSLGETGPPTTEPTVISRACRELMKMPNEIRYIIKQTGAKPKTVDDVRLAIEAWERRKFIPVEHGDLIECRKHTWEIDIDMLVRRKRFGPGWEIIIQCPHEIKTLDIQTLRDLGAKRITRNGAEVWRKETK